MDKSESPQGPGLSGIQDTPDTVAGAGSALPKASVFTPVVQIAYPPIIKEIDEVFHVIGKPVLYAWGDIIFNPLGVPITQPLFLHEAVHGIRQGSQIEEWWKQYLTHPAFRLDEEVLAHQEEWRVFKATHKDRNIRASYLRRISQRLSGPLYGGMIGFTDAKKVIESARGTAFAKLG